jgi:hypothetical protein
MRKCLLIVAMLLIAVAPVMATVTVTARHTGFPVKAGIPCTTCEVNYVCSGGEKVRAFALEITVDSGYTITGIKDFNTGESNKAPNTGPGYGIFPGKFRDVINAADPNWTVDANYNPIAPATDLDAGGTGLGTNKIIVEMGSLYVGDNNAPLSAGPLFRFDIQGPTGKDCNMVIAANTSRGGVVLEDGSTLAATFVGGKAGFPDLFPCWQPYSVQYNDWVSVWKPKCWAGQMTGDANWRTQCWGDVDGKAETVNKYRVYTSDYTKLMQAWSKKATVLKTGGGVDGNWMCADIDHKYETVNRYRVYTSDYTRMMQGWSKKETVLKPWCPQ